MKPDNDHLIAPQRVGNILRPGEPWRGSAAKNPWSYEINVVIPHLDTPGPLEVAVELWRAQTVRPFITIIDTGSLSEHHDRINALEADDVEIHWLRGRGWRHSSQLVSVAQDVALATCRSRYQFCTHSDVFPMGVDVLEWFRDRCSAQKPLVGYEISPRDHVPPGWLRDNWRGLLGHTATMMHVDTIRRLGINWDYERALACFPELSRDNPRDFDTEVGFGLHVKAAGIVPTIVGHDVNERRQTDHLIDHVRSHASSKAFASEYHRKAAVHMAAAIAEARNRLAIWQQIDGAAA